MPIEITKSGWTWMSEKEFKEELEMWMEQLGNPGPCEMLYDEMIDWLDDAMISDDEIEGYEKDNPNRVIVTLSLLGEVEINSFVEKK